MNSLLRGGPLSTSGGGPLSTSVSDTVSSFSNVYSQLVAQMMGNHQSTTRSVHDVLDGTEVNGRRIEIMEKTEATSSSVISEAAPSVGEKRKGAIPAVKSGNFNRNLLLVS